jgi:tetratricopeptide (TPR) repeat protein
MRSWIILLLFFTCCASQNAEVFFSKGNKIYDEGTYSEAMKYYSKAINKNPNYADAYWGRALCKYQLKDYSGAKDDFSKVVELNDKVEALYYRAMCNFMLKDTLGACNDWNYVCERNYLSGCTKYRLYCK